MKRLLMLIPFVALCASDVPAPKEAKKLQLWVSCVAWKVDDKPGFGVYANVGESEDVMGPTVSAAMKTSFPKGYTILSMKTTRISDRMIDELVENRRAWKEAQKK